MKKMPVLSKEFVRSEFGDVEVMNETWKLHDKIKEALKDKNSIVLLMSSGTFDGLSKELVLSWI
jgi:hypothetical protein